MFTSSYTIEFNIAKGVCVAEEGCDFHAGDLDWESHTVCKHSLNRQINETIISVIYVVL